MSRSSLIVEALKEVDEEVKKRKEQLDLLYPLDK